MQIEQLIFPEQSFENFQGFASLPAQEECLLCEKRGCGVDDERLWQPLRVVSWPRRKFKYFGLEIASDNDLKENLDKDWLFRAKNQKTRSKRLDIAKTKILGKIYKSCERNLGTAVAELRRLHTTLPKSLQWVLKTFKKEKEETLVRFTNSRLWM